MKFLLCFIICQIILSCGQIGERPGSGETHAYMKNNIAVDLLKEYERALDVYYNTNNYYPLSLGNEVPEELESSLQINETYQYCSATGLPRNEACKKWYIAVGSNKLKITLTCTDHKNYRLLFFGVNGIDENGMGDDLFIKNGKSNFQLYD